jgi:hypothetical protein
MKGFFSVNLVSSSVPGCTHDKRRRGKRRRGKRRRRRRREEGFLAKTIR